jgi:hypothetical protein
MFTAISVRVVVPKEENSKLVLLAKVKVKLFRISTWE